MIRFLKGRVEDIGADYVALDVNGVGYEAHCSSRTLANLEKDVAVKLSIYTHVREDALILFGFSDDGERGLFEKLTSISGVGPKAGLAILSALSPSDIVQAVQAQDGKMLSRANGVGPKLGGRIVMELKDKIGGIHVDGAEVAPVASGSAASDVISALMNLGYKQAQAQTAVSRAQKVDDAAGFDVLFKLALQELR